MSWNKFGSPYDPNYSGKMMRPQDREAMERLEREMNQHRLRGCGDPNCPICNPETAFNRRGGGSYTENRPRSGVNPSGGWVSDWMRGPFDEAFIPRQ